MLYEKKKVLILRLIPLSIFLLFALVMIIDSAIPGPSLLQFWILMEFFVLIWVIIAFRVKFREYDYNDNYIVVYSGTHKHYVLVNGIKVDEYNTRLWFGSISLSTTLDDGSYLIVRITASNSVTLKINDRLIMHRTRIKKNG